MSGQSDESEEGMPVVPLPPQDGGASCAGIDSEGPVVLLGPNGAGKSRLGAWMENGYPDPSHILRITAQKRLDFRYPEAVYPRAQCKSNWLAFGGTQNGGWNSNPEWLRQTRDNSRYSRHGIGDPLNVTSVPNDFQAVLGLLIGEENAFNARYRDDRRRVMTSNTEVPTATPAMRPDKDSISPFDKLKRLWERVMTQRDLKFDGEQFTSRLVGSPDYPARNMSDGERVALYLLAQVILVDPKTLLIIDEPELHLHRSIRHRLWDAAEDHREDCRFVYITHDLDFAASRRGATWVWVKSYDGTDWRYEIIQSEPEIPANLILEIHGPKDKVLLVEGVLDCQVFSALFPEHLVLARGSCHQVQRETQALRSSQISRTKEVLGLVDRDLKPDDEVRELTQSGIAVLEVAIVENLLCVEPLFRAVAALVCVKDVDAHVQRFHERIKELFQSATDELRLDELKMLLEWKLRRFAPPAAKSVSDLAKAIEAFKLGLDAEELSRSCSQIDSGSGLDDVPLLLKLYKRKGLPHVAASLLDMKRDRYLAMATDILQRNPEVAAEVKRSILMPSNCG